MKLSRLRQLIDAQKERGYVLCDEIRELLPEDYEGGREFDDILLELVTAGIEIFEEPKVDFESNDDYDDVVGVYVREVCQAPKLTSASEMELAKTIERGGEEAEAAMAQRLESNLRLVVSIAALYADRDVHILDLVQEGYNGLLKAPLSTRLQVRDLCHLVGTPGDRASGAS
jgi:RNA polymerase primary sigma factor